MTRLRTGRSGVVAALCACALTCGVVAAPGTAQAWPRGGHHGGGHHRGWVAGWTASSTAAPTDSATCPAHTGISGATIRDVVRVTAGGNRVRIRLTDAFGDRPLRVGHATVAVRGAGAATVPGTMRTVTFHGRRSVTVPTGHVLLSDPVHLHIRSLQHLAVSVYLPRPTGPATQHPLALQDSYVSTAGDHTTGRTDGAYPTTVDCWMYVDAVDVAAHRYAGTLVALGDSITDGYKSTPNTDSRWPDDLADRLTAVHGRTPSVANAGISGNEILLDRVPVTFGVSALHRLRRDVISQPDVRSVILLEGINDIGAAHATAASLIAGDRRIIARLHARGIRVYGGTLTPFTGSNAIYGGDYGTPYGERQREALNHWIRTGGAFDAVIDFDRAVADPANPHRMALRYDSGDHLHPSDAGYAAMAAAVPLHLLLHRLPHRH